MADNFSLEKNIELWPRTWGKLIERKFEGKLGPPEKPLPKEHYKTWGKSERNDPCPCGITGKKYKNCCGQTAWG